MRLSRLICWILFSWSSLISIANSSVVYNHSQVQRGAHLFMLHCSGCHSLRYMRYSRLSDDLSLSQRSYDPVLSSLSTVQSQSWFGKVPPDLSLVAQEKGGAWLLAYLSGFYPDQHRPFGVNNSVIPDVAMPDVLFGLTAQDEQRAIQDLIAFLDYTAAPERGLRYFIGAAVLIILVLFIITLLRQSRYP